VKYYSIVEMDITDRGWVETYVANVTKMVERYGGRYLARTNRAEKLEGERPPAQIYVIVEWPSRDAAQTFYDCDEYRPFRDARMRGAKGEFFLVPAEDVTRQARVE
jgi:uncharacterized protein (DUF1330 family)